MAKYHNVSGKNVHVSEHRIINTNAKAEFTDEEVSGNYLIANAIKGGWFIPFIESIAVQTVQGEFNNEINRISGQATHPLDVQFDITPKSVEEEKPAYIKDALARAEATKVKVIKDAAIKKALGEDEDYTGGDTYVGPEQYGNIELNPLNNVTTVGEDGAVGTVAQSPSQTMNDQADLIVKAASNSTEELPETKSTEKEADLKPKVKAPVKKTK